MREEIPIPKDLLGEFCRRWKILEDPAQVHPGDGGALLCPAMKRTFSTF
jgi:hypothetical protein